MRNFTKLLILFVLCLVGMQGNAQNVTISPNSGSLIAALTYEGEVGFENGWSAMWRHEQLALTVTVSDDDLLTDAGEIANPAGNLIEYQRNTTVGNKIVMAGGVPHDGFMVVSLPKGYRITGYEMILLNNLNGRTVSGLEAGSSNKTLYETNNHFDYNTPKAQTSQMGTTNSDTQEYKISRDGDDMGNHLYFRLVHDHQDFFAITIKSFMLYFTAEGTFEADVKPDEVGRARSVVAAPFKTSKIDIGDLKTETKNGKTYFAYNYNNVRDLDANNYIYQANTVHDEGDVVGEPVEGDEEKTIYPVRVDGNNLYAFGNNTYFVETPIQVHTQSGLEAPVGYRIVGARFNYLWGTATTAGSQTFTNHYYVTATRNNRTYYLNDHLTFTTNPFEWEYDSDTKTLHTGSGEFIRYLSCTGEDDTRTLSLSYDKDNYYNLIVFTRNNTTYVGWDNNTAYQRYYLRYYYDYYNSTWRVEVTRNNTNYSARANSVSHTITYPSFTPGAYTLKVYDKEGNYVEGTDGKPTKGLKAVVSSESAAGGILELDNLNNDAVKFQIEGLENGKQALVSITLLLEALDPYINKMDIVCHDPNEQLTLSQPFTADDFTVSGGKFVFYIPEDYADTELTFTFSDLYSQYGDNTYYTGTDQEKDGNARYSFVTSDYFSPVNGNGNNGLYDNAYSPDASYTSKISTSKAGNIRFKFNNAEDLGNQGTGTGYLQETPFSVATYLGSANPDATNGKPEGAFVDCVLKASDEGRKSGIYYVFTADETRYNIAPTKAWQHRYYAFYRMDIELQAKSYTPDLTWTKIYDKTCYFGEDNFPNPDKGNTPLGGALTKSMWGVKLATKDNNNIVKGYLTVKEILDAIDKRTKDDSAAPKDLDQILYVDGSDLYSIINSSVKENETTTTLNLSNLKQNLGQNALVFLPENTTSTLNNFIYKTSTGSFRAGKDIVLTDRMPFYSPYDIQVDAANEAVYTRTVTREEYGKDLLASVMLPYALDVTDGVHTNPDNSTFTLTEMKSADVDVALVEQQKNDYYGESFFSPVEGTSTVANKPYMVVVDEESADEGNYSFVAAQTAAKILATPLTGMQTRTAGSGTYKYLYMGDEVNGSFTTANTSNGTLSGSITLTPEGSYSGQIYDRAHSEKIFYFAKNKLFNLYRLVNTKRYLYIYPFRSVYSFTGNITSQVKSMNGFNISFEDPSDLDGIRDMSKAYVPDLAVRSGKGFIQFTADSAQTVNILSLNGTSYSTVTMNAGDSKTISLPAGVYVVNNVKIIVK